MTPQELAEQLGFALAVTPTEGRAVTSVYCCDLLSLAMGRAPADSAWVTVMGNVNAVAVASLTDVSCLVLAEGMPLDEEARRRAEENGIAVLITSLPVYQAAKAIDQAVSPS